MLNNNDKHILLAGIQNGIGFTRSCSLIDKSPREISGYIKENLEVYKSVLESHQRYKHYLLSLANELANKKNVTGWLNQIKKLKAAPDKIYFWEDYCKREDANKEKIIRAHHILQDEQETATACGFEYEEFVDFITEDNELDIYFSNPLLK